MKHNLANFPKMVADSTTNEQEVIVWKNGIEKELRERLATDGTFEFKRPHQRLRSRTTEVGKFIKEVLGGVKR